jgi:CubicO group peptidase (beta-lactamase class C family)
MSINVFRISRLVGVATLTLLFAACGGGSPANGSPQPPATYQYTVPPQKSDGWTTGHLDDHGFDTVVISDMMQRIVDGQFDGIDSVLIVRDNTLLLYSTLRSTFDVFDDWIDNRNLERHILHSTSKSVTSALIGIAIDQGYIPSTQVSFYELFNYGVYDNWDTRKSDMTLEDALTMRLGIVWDEWSIPYGEQGNDLYELTSNNTDFAKALLDLPMESNPGTTYAYNTAASITIGQALENAVGVPMASFANTHLFSPMQITTAEWGRTPTGLPDGGSGLFLEPRDMAKFGQIFVDDGRWNGQQIVSPEWVQLSVQRHVALNWDGTSGYGFQWWLDDFSFAGQALPSWSTRGYGGQYIFCIPALKLVVTFTGQNYGTSGAQQLFDLMQDFILPSLENSG